MASHKSASRPGIAGTVLDSVPAAERELRWGLNLSGYIEEGAIMSALSPISLFSPLIAPQPFDFLQTTANARLLSAATQNNLPELRAFAAEAGRALAAIGTSIPDLSAQSAAEAIGSQIVLNQPIQDETLRLLGLEVFRIQMRVLELLSGDLGISNDSALDLLAPTSQ